MSGLFKSIKIGDMELRNRLVMPAMNTNFAAEDGSVTQRTIEYYRERAHGGVGLVIVEGAYVHPLGRGLNRQISLTSDDKVPGLSNLACAIHSEGAKAAVQLFHGGRQSSSVILGRQPVSASDVMCLVTKEKPRPLTSDEMRETVEAFGEATRRIDEAGFDAVEIHAAHGYLINQFLSPLTNLRKDMYGGGFTGRTRFLLEIIQSIKKKTRRGFPIICRLNGDDYYEGGLTLADAKKIARAVEEAGVDAIHVSGGIYDSKNGESTAPMWLPRGFMVPLAHAIKESAGIPIIAVGRINDVKLAGEIVDKGEADLVSMGRAIIADPEAPRKAMEGKHGQIRPCIACNEGCINMLSLLKPITCILNAAVGREEEFQLRPAKKSKNLVVAGGGVAGMEFARVVALRGHHVSLYEEDDHLGGQVLLASIPSYKHELGTIIPYYRQELERLKVEINLRKKVDKSLIDDLGPDLVCIATGSTPIVPRMPGIMGKNVFLATDALAGRAELGDKLVILGGGEVGLETGFHFAEQGKQVTILEQMKRVGTGMVPLFNSFVRHRLADLGGRLLTLARVVEINKEGAVYEKEGQRITEYADNVLIALGAVANHTLAETIENGAVEVYIIGDASKPGKIMDAVHSAAQIAKEV